MSSNSLPSDNLLSNSLLGVKIAHRVGTLALNLEFALTQPWTVLFGPSGSGKTTMLRAIAGFVRPDAGRIGLGSQLLFDSSSGVCLSPYKREVRIAAQKPYLFPGTVERNVGYGVRARPGDAKEWVKELLELFHLKYLAAADVTSLSGGERQRVALARVCAATFSYTNTYPLLLLDEPFTGMDAALRARLVIELRDWLVERKVPVLSVTHDIGEAFQLEADVIKIADGRVMAQGPVSQVLAEERARLLAQLAGW